ncbi:MAG: N-acetylmuramoyl-L-alanine amidase [Tannerella sp.]|jgi:N-acetylmuramoyl-L-alanine amidase|nr:N-acetylmuramoyl-L-alanine amidase [Tannerella sp.]
MKRKTFITTVGLLAFLFAWATPVLRDKQQSFTVVIDAGHGGRDPGSIGSAVKEKVINLAVALKLGKMISDKHKDVNVIYTRKTDRFVELIERANIANRHNADLFISIHANSIKKASSVKGAETYTLGLAKTQENLEVAMLENSVIMLEDNYEQRYEGFDPNSSESYIIFEYLQNTYLEQSISLASGIQKAFASAKRTNRGVRQAGFLVLKATSMPSVLIELGFISSREEEKYMRSEAGQNQLAKSIYTAFAKYKDDFDRRQSYSDSSSASKIRNGSANPAKNEQKQTTADTTGKEQTAPANHANRQIVYKVQILSSDKRLPAGSPKLKGYKADYYEENRLYKYTYGESTDFNAIQQIQKKVSKDFKDAFIIRTRDGKRLNPNEK